jgi:hypothetical protein
VRAVSEGAVVAGVGAVVTAGGVVVGAAGMGRGTFYRLPCDAILQTQRWNWVQVTTYDDHRLFGALNLWGVRISGGQIVLISLSSSLSALVVSPLSRLALVSHPSGEGREGKGGGSRNEGWSQQSGDGGGKSGVRGVKRVRFLMLHFVLRASLVGLVGGEVPLVIGVD